VKLVIVAQLVVLGWLVTQVLLGLLFMVKALHTKGTTS
jgi:hypothetical protein